MFFFFKQKTAYEMRISDGVQTCALPICRRARARIEAQRERQGGAQSPHPPRYGRRRGALEETDRGGLRRHWRQPDAAAVVGRTQSRQPARSPLPLLRRADRRSEEHTSELQSLMRISYGVFCL